MTAADRPAFLDVDEIYIFRVHDGKLASAFGSRTAWPGCASSASAREIGRGLAEGS